MNNVVVVDTSIALKWVLSEVDSDIALALVVEWTKKKVDLFAPALLMRRRIFFIEMHVLIKSRLRQLKMELM